MKLLTWAAKILLGLAALSAIVGLFYMAWGVWGPGKEKSSNLAVSTKSLEFKEYDSVTVTGAEAINAAELFAQRAQFAVQIVTKATSFYAVNTSAATQVCYSNASPSVTTTCGTPVAPSAMRDTTNTNFVNPTASFKADLYRDSNSIVRLVRLVQQ